MTDNQNPSGYSQTLEETNKAGAPTAAYAWGSGGALAQRTGAGVVADGSNSQSALESPQTLHGDHLGSTRLLTDASGEAVEGTRYEYNPFGTHHFNAYYGNATALTALKFTGQYADGDLGGLQYHRARWLNTTRAAWLSADPVYDFPGNFGNAYGYAGQNPINLNDLTGMFSGGEIAVSAAINSVLSVAMNGIINVISTGDSSEFFTGWGKAAGAGAITGAIGGGIFFAANKVFLALGNIAAKAAFNAFLVTFLAFDLPLSLYGLMNGLASAETEREVAIVAASSVVGFLLTKRSFSKQFKPKPLIRQSNDISVDPRAPAPRPVKGRKVSPTSTTQNQAVQNDAALALAQGATDIRINQQQVNISGNRVGINRPDLQYTLDGKRYYIEYENPTSPRDLPHEYRTLSNDPDAIHITRYMS